MTATSVPALVPPLGRHQRDTIGEDLQATLVELIAACNARACSSFRQAARIRTHVMPER